MSKTAAAGPRKKPFSSSLRFYVVFGAALCMLLVFAGGGWAAMARLSSAVIANGKVVVASNVKQVQHPDGGIVGELLVTDGDEVAAGELLIRLDEKLLAANRALADSQIIALKAQLARLEAERDEADDLALPQELLDRIEEPAVARAVEAERKVFRARADTLKRQAERLTERANQLEQQIVGLESQKTAKEDELALIDDELEILEGLFERGRTTRDKLVALKRNRMRLRGEHGELTSRIAMTRGRINETQLEILQLSVDRREEVLGQITALGPELANLEERRLAADVQLGRTDIRSPVDGTVFELAAHTVGGVVGPGETIMQIVPHGDALLIEARVPPRDIDEVAVGQPADIVLSAFDLDAVPKLRGTVRFVSAETTQDEQTGLSYYRVRIDLADGELDRVPPDLGIVPGMPAEVYIQTGGRTVISYLMTPLTEQVRRAWRES